MRKNRLLFFTLIFFVSASSLISNEKFSNTNKVYQSAGINTEQLVKVDSDIKNLLYFTLTQNNKIIRNLKPAPGNPVVFSKDNKDYVSVFIKTQNPNLTRADIELNGGSVSNIISDIVLAELPIKSLTQVVFDTEIDRVETSKYQEALLDTSLHYINVDKVHQGIDLPKAYKGEGVVVGVIDSGIDWTHPAFSNGNGNRIKYLWDMSDDTNPPADFDYGTEYTKEELDQQNSNQIDDDGHGTHVASTSAGNANGNDYPLDGVAPEADIIFVKGYRTGPYFSNTDVVNGCDYIFKKADELGKPAAINLSIGGLSGSTGNTLYEQSLSNLVGPGKLIAAAAGNQGSSNLHLQYQMSGSTIDERSNTPWRVPDSTKGVTSILGYPQSEDFNFGIQAQDSEGKLVFFTPPIGHEQNTSGAMVVDGDTVANIILSGGPFTNEPYFFSAAILYSSDTGIKNYTFNLYTFGSAFFNAWIRNGVFSNVTDPGQKLIGGDNLMTINSPSSAFNVFSIGAFSTTLSWTDINGNPFEVDGTIKDRAYFSSVGPLRDGRIKPDFSAPGHHIAAGYSKDASYPDYLALTDNTVYLQGTSMATPHFTGVLALLLEQDPDLTYEQAFALLEATSISDELTDNVPNNDFGYGRIDALAALQQLITSVEEDDVVPAEFSLSQNYPNPFNPSTTIEYSVPSKSHVTLKVYDVLGNEITTLVSENKSVGKYRVSLDGSELSSGVYFYRISAGNFQEVKKMMFIK